jgi:hypothetical protein
MKKGDARQPKSQNSLTAGNIRELPRMRRSEAPNANLWNAKIGKPFDQTSQADFSARHENSWNESRIFACIAFKKPYNCNDLRDTRPN